MVQIKNDNLEPDMLVIHCYRHQKRMLIDMETTTLLFKGHEYYLVEQKKNLDDLKPS